MKSLCINLILATFLVIGSIYPLMAQNSEQIYQKGLMKEEGEGALNEAIVLYKQIVENPDAVKSLQAKALLHIGMCFEKMGNQEATKAYQNLVNNFPGQESEVAIAKERLSHLIFLAEKISKAPLVPKFTKIKMPFNPGNGLLSPDGKNCAFISKGSVWIIPVSGEVDPYIAGEPKKLTENLGAWDWNGSFSWSRDGKWIAFNAEDDLQSSASSIYIVSSNGGDPQKVQVPDREGSNLREYRVSLSPDGKILAYASGRNEFGDYDSQNTRIYTIPVNGSQAKELTEPGTYDPAFSPDGSKIAYVKSYKSDDGQLDYDVWLVPSKGGVPIQISNLQSGWVRGPIWSADGKMIAFHRRGDRGEPKEIWIVPISEDGSPSEAPRKIDLPQSAYQSVAGWSSENVIGLQLTNPEYEIIYTVPAKGGIATQVTPQGWTSYPKWSPDGKKIFFRWDGGKIASVPSSGGEVDSILIQSEFNIYTAAPGTGNDISPDGKTIVFSGVKNFYVEGEKQWEVDIFTIPIGGGKPKQLTTSGKLQDRFPCWSPDGNTIAFIRPQLKDNKQICQIHIISKDGENLKVITDESHKVAFAPIDWAPDGKYITFFSDDSTIKSILINGEGLTTITEISKANRHNELAWSPDGKELAYTDKNKIWILSKKSGITKEVKTGVDEQATKICWSPDGKKIAFTAYGGGDAELWLMENFLPLEKLKAKDEKAEPIPKTISSIKVWSGPNTDNSGTPSSNGKFLSYMDQETGNVAMREFSTGKTSLLTKEGTWENPMQFTIGSIVSPNSKHVAYSWYNVKSNYEVRLIDVNNPQPKVLYGNKDEDVYPAAWSPDGKTIYARSYLNITKQCRILAVDVASGDIQVLKTFDFFYWMYLCVSPDNQFIAFDAPKDNDKGNFDIHIISTDGKNETSLVEHPANDRLLGWFPDKNQVFFKSDRSGSSEAWIASVSNGKAVGEPKRLLPEIGEISPMGFTNNGSYYYSIFSRKFNAYTAPFDVKKGKINLESRKPILGSIPHAELSPDSKFLAYTKELKETAGAGWYHRPLFILNLETGKERILLDWNQIRNQRWSPDGKSLLLIGYDIDREAKKDNDGGIYSIELESGKVSELLAFTKAQENEAEVSLNARSVAEWAKDQKSIYYTTNNQLINRELKSGEEKILLENQEVNRTLVLSNDGKTLLFSTRKQLFTIPISGGETINLFTLDQENSIRNATWSPDGNYIFFAEQMSNIKDGSVLWMISSEGKNPKEVCRFKGPLSSISIHPNGKEIVLSTFNQETEIWRFDNLLSEEDTFNKQK